MKLTSIVVFLFASIYRVATADDDDRSSDGVLSFLLLGDWGKGGTSGTYGQRRALESVTTAAEQSQIELSEMELQKEKEKKVFRQMQVATAMGQYAAQTSPKPSFLIALGDNFYGDGVYSTSDPLWQYLWKDVYLGFEDLNIPWFPVFGNHDYGYGATGVKAQIARTYEHTDDDIWTFPSTNYTRRFAIPGEGGGSVAVVFIDTTTLAPTVNKCCNSNGGVSTTTQQERIANQLAHIERMLNDTLADPPTWLLVAGHYPVYSASTQGDTAELQTYLLPLLEKYKVHAYLCGHDHIGEHLQKSGQYTEYFVVGAGTMVDTISKTSNAELIWAGPNYASFAAVNVTLSNLTIAYRDTNGTVRYSYTLTNPNPLFVPTIGGGGGNNGGGSGDGGSGGGTGDGGGEGNGGEGDEGSSANASHSFFSWSFWADAAGNASDTEIAMASGGFAAIGLVCFFFFVVYKRKNKDDKDKAASQLLLRARNQEMLHSPNRATPQKISSFYGRKKYAELREMGDLEQGEVTTQSGRHRTESDGFSDEDDEYSLDIVPGTANKDHRESPQSRSRSSTQQDAGHSRSSSLGSVANSTLHGRYSHSLSSDQTAAAAAWLESHPAGIALAGISPPPPSPGGDLVPPPERFNPIHVARLSPGKNASGGSPAPGTPHSPSPNQGSPLQQQPDSSPAARPPTRGTPSSASRRMTSSEGIGMGLDAMMVPSESSAAGTTGTPTSAPNRVHFSAHQHRRSNTTLH